MGEDIQSHVNTCSVCNRFKALNRKPKASLQSYTVGYPLDGVAIDVIGPLPHTRQNNKFKLVIGDHFTRWMLAFPLPHQQTEKDLHIGILMAAYRSTVHPATGYVSKLKSKLEEIYQISAVRQKKDTRISQNQFCKGSLVYKFNNILKKLNERWSGPFEIYNCNWADCLYEGKKRDTIWHIILNHVQEDQVPF
ncbi:unnamed protein product [Mytilus coruscus]|uniref:Integrase catalytic domain-containing protein n=1 Tax=Mytilus coruscus TaxID=42192 RepID=A0A6J8BHF5_MYTCO|nr:unnamed protein product [Mytilus coruscus]